MIEWIKYKLTGEPTTKMKLDMANKTVHNLMVENRSLKLRCKEYADYIISLS